MDTDNSASDLQDLRVESAGMEDYRLRLHPDDRESLDALLGVCLDGSSTVLRTRWRSGWRLVEHVVKIREGDGQPVIRRRDVTEREMALEYSNQTAAFWRALLRNGKEAIAVVDDRLVVLHASESLGRILRLPAQSLVGRSALRWTDKRDFNTIRVAMAADESIQTIEVRLVSPEIGSRWFEATVSDARDDVDVGAIIVNLRGIDHRKRAEAQLKSSERLFRLLAEQVADGCVVVDETGIVTYASPRASQLLSTSVEALIGARFPLVVDIDRLRFDQRSSAGVGDAFELLPAEIPLDDGRWVEVTLQDLRSDPVVGGSIVILRDITKMREMTESLRADALHDPLTGLLNRRGLEEWVRNLLPMSGRIAIGFLDLDDFKAVNDIYGHRIGDHVLQKMADRLQSLVRRGDCVVRLGGDEFVFGVSQIVASELPLLSSRISDISRAPFVVEDQVVAVGASIGWSFLDDDTSLADALAAADQLMYNAKRLRRQ